MAAGTVPERINWYQCTRFLLEGGRTILKEFFMKSYNPGTLNRFLNAKHNKDIIDFLHQKKILRQDQLNILFPNADIDCFDITLLSCIISNCVTKRRNAKHKAVNEIRMLRNSLYGHVSTLSMTGDEFEKNWNIINRTLLKTKKILRVTFSLSELTDEIKNEEVVNKEDMERMRKKLERWERFDDVLSAFEEVASKVKKSLKCMQETTEENNSSIGDIKYHVKKVEHKLKSGFKEVKAELKSVKSVPNED